MTTGTYNIRISAEGNGEKAVKNLDKEMKSAHKTSTGLKDSFKMLAGAAGIGLAIAGIRSMIRNMKEYRNLAMVQINAEKDLAATIKSTGGAAGVTAEEAKKLASELQKVTNFGDEVTIRGQAMLLTFTKIGKDVFPQATEAMLNMSQKMGVDVNQSAIQLGKALNDPILGVTALRRVGVALTAQQEEQIKKMVEVGDVAGAQKVILSELETEFGGLARGMADPWKQLQNQIGDVKEIIGGALHNVLKAVAPVISSLVKAIEEILPAVLPIVESIGKQLAPILESLAPIIARVVEVGAKLIESIFDALQPVLPVVTNLIRKLLPIVERLGVVFGKLLEALKPVIELIAREMIEQSDLLIEVLDAMLTVLEELMPLFVELAPAIADTTRMMMVLVNGPAKILLGIARGIVDAVKWIIESADKAIGAISAIFGGGPQAPGKLGAYSGKGVGILGAAVMAAAGMKPDATGGGSVAGKAAGGGGGAKKNDDAIARRFAAQQSEVEQALAWEEARKDAFMLQVEAINELIEKNHELTKAEAERALALDEQAIAYREGIQQQAEEEAEYQRKKAQAEQEYALETAEMVGSLMTGLFGQSKGAAIAEAMINTGVGATKALSQGGVLGLLTMISVIAAGMKQVQTIQGIEPEGRAAGGDMYSGMYQVGEQGPEFAVNAQAARRNRQTLLAMNSGATIGDNYGYKNASIPSGAGRSRVDVGLSGEFRIRGADLVASYSKTLSAELQGTL